MEIFPYKEGVAKAINRLMKKETLFTLILKLFSARPYKKEQGETAAPVKENIWGLSGRKAQMDAGMLMQLRPFTGSDR